MTKQQAITATPKQLQLRLWKRLVLVTALFLSGGPLAVMASTQAAYASTASPHNQPHREQEVQFITEVVVICISGNGGKAGKAMQKSSGASGGSGGDCTVTIPIQVPATTKNNVLLSKMR